MASAADDFDIDTVDVGEEEAPKTNVAKQLRDYAKSLKKERDELAKELGTFRTASRTSTLAETLKSKGVPDEKLGIAKYFPNDAEVSDTAIDEWLGENAELFGIVKKANVDDDTRTAIERMQDASSTAPPAASRSVEEFSAALKTAKTRTERDAVYQRFGWN